MDLTFTTSEERLLFILYYEENRNTCYNAAMDTDGEHVKRELYKTYLILTRNLYQQSQPDLNTPNIGELRKRFLVGSVIFLAFAMESFINDFGDRFIDDFEDFEKLETLNKFLLFPRISRENPIELINKSESPHAALKLLFKYRNYFVHYKPAFRGTGTSDERLYTELDHTQVKNLYEEMIELLKNFNNQFQMFIDGDDWITEYSNDINAGT